MRISESFITRWGLTFRCGNDTWHSYRDFGLLPASPPDFGSPVVKTNSIPITGSHGRLDLTDVFGFVMYDNRLGTFTYYLPDRREAAQKTLHSRLMNLFHGKTVQVIPDESPGWYYVGRLFVGPIVQGGRGAYNTITITADLEPYRYAVNDPPYEAVEISGYHNAVTIQSSPLGGTPWVRNNGEDLMLLTIDNTEYQIPAGETVELTEVELPRSWETVTWDVSCPEGSGTITIWFKRGEL